MYRFVTAQRNTGESERAMTEAAYVLVLFALNGSPACRDGDEYRFFYIMNERSFQSIHLMLQTNMLAGFAASRGQQGRAIRRQRSAGRMRGVRSTIPSVMSSAS